MTAITATWWPATALALVLGLLWLVQRAARAGWIRLPRPAATSSERSLAVVEVLALDTRRRLQLVRCSGRHVLILTGGTQDILLGWVPEDTQCGR